MYAATHWEYAGGPTGGSVTALAASADGRLFAATLAGLYRSDDGAASWKRISADPRLLFLSALALAPGTQPAALILAASLEGGIFRSSDGGHSWAAADCGGQQLRISTLALSPAVQHDGLAFASTLDQGVWRSRDAGASWEPCNFGLLDLRVLDLCISPAFSSDQTLFAATSAGVFRSQNGGRAWRELDLPPEAAPVQCLASSPGFVEDALLLAGTEAAGIWRSTDRGRSWQPLAGPEPGLCVNALVVLPGPPGAQRVLAASSSALYLSIDAGASWRTCAELPAAPLCLALTASQAALVGLAGAGIYRSSDELAGWQMANAGLYGRLLSGLCAPPAGEPQLLVFGPGEGLLGWQQREARWTALHASLPSLEVRDLAWVGAPQGGPALYAALPEGLWLRDGRHGTWEQLTDLPAQALALSPAFADDGTLLLATRGRGLWISHDRGRRWTQLAAPGPDLLALALTPAFAQHGTLVVAVNAADGLGLEVWQGSSAGAWERVIRHREAARAALLAIAPAFAHDWRWYAAVGSQLYRPLRAAVEVRRGKRLPFFVGQPLAPERPAILALSASAGEHPGELLAATEQGLYRSLDSGASWDRIAAPTSQPYVALARASPRGPLYVLELGGRIWALRGPDDAARPALEGL